MYKYTQVVENNNNTHTTRSAWQKFYCTFIEDRNFLFIIYPDLYHSSLSTISKRKHLLKKKVMNKILSAN